MKTIVHSLIAAALIVNGHSVAAQSSQRRLIARTNQVDGVLDSLRFYYGGTKTGNRVNAEADMLPAQTATRNGLIVIPFDSAVAWQISGANRNITERVANTFDFANRLVHQKRIQYSGGTIAEDAAFSYTALGLMDSAQYSSSSMGAVTVAYTYTNAGFPLSDTFLNLPSGIPFMSVLYSYNPALQLITKVRHNISLPGQTIADSTTNRYNASGLLETTDAYLFDSGNVYRREQDSFGYAGASRQHAYKNARFIDYRLSPAWVNKTRNIYHLRSDGKYDTIKNFVATSAGPYPTTPSQLINVSYNTDSTVHQVVGFSMGSPIPFVNYRYYYANVGNTNIAKITPAPSCSIIAYPVPAQPGALQIVISGIKRNAAYWVTNALGQTVQEGDAQPNMPFRLKEVPAGTYTIRCADRSHKILVQ